MTDKMVSFLVRATEGTKNLSITFLLFVDI